MFSTTKFTKDKKDAQRAVNFFFTKALKARPVKAMGTTHGIEVTYDFPSRLPTPSGNKRQMREYGDVYLGIYLPVSFFFNHVVMKVRILK